jgi:hypothetical protein
MKKETLMQDLPSNLSPRKSNNETQFPLLGIHKTHRANGTVWWLLPESETFLTVKSAREVQIRLSELPRQFTMGRSWTIQPYNNDEPSRVSTKTTLKVKCKGFLHTTPSRSKTVECVSSTTLTTTTQVRKHLNTVTVKSSWSCLRSTSWS